jgi:mRNA-degrading endonuclease toxin of MazEF toxin-antitoxin module
MVEEPWFYGGHEQRENRYAVVVQPDLLPLSTWLVAPTSTSARPASFRPASFRPEIETSRPTSSNAH